jgi:hypothetical protein
MEIFATGPVCVGHTYNISLREGDMLSESISKQQCIMAWWGKVLRIYSSNLIFHFFIVQFFSFGTSLISLFSVQTMTPPVFFTAYSLTALLLIVVKSTQPQINPAGCKSDFWSTRPHFCKYLFRSTFSSLTFWLSRNKFSLISSNGYCF